MPGEEISREELKALKRQAAIRAKEDEFEKKRKEQEQRKRQELETLKEEFDNQEKKKVLDRLAFLEKQAAARAQKKMRTEKLNQKRDVNIQKKNEAWLRRANEEIGNIQDEQAAEEERVQLALEEAREEKRKREQAVREAKGEAKAKLEELEMYRNEADQNRKAQRDLRAIYRVDQLKTEATEELESFLVNPYPIPLKQVLAGRMRIVPTVTELLAAHKDQKEELAELEAMDIPTRAMLRNQTLFQYVKDIQLKAEAVRIHPPQPQQADLGRSRNRGSSPRKASPTSPKRK